MCVREGGGGGGGGGGRERERGGGGGGGREGGKEGGREGGKEGRKEGGREGPDGWRDWANRLCSPAALISLLISRRIDPPPLTLETEGGRLRGGALCEKMAERFGHGVHRKPSD